MSRQVAVAMAMAASSSLKTLLGAVACDSCVTFIKKLCQYIMTSCVTYLPTQ